MALVSQSTKTALQRQFEVLAELLSSVDNRLSSILKDLGHLFVGDANATLVYLNKALKDIPRFETGTNPKSATISPPVDTVRDYLESYNGLAKDEIPDLVVLIETVEKDKDKVGEIVQSYKGYLKDPNRFWASFSELDAGDSIRQTVRAIEHHSTSSPLARRLLCRRLSLDVTTKAQQLEKKGAVLRTGLSYRDLAFHLSLGKDWQKHSPKLREGDRWVGLDAGVLPGIKGTNWKRWGRTTKAGIRAINDYLKMNTVTATYQKISASIEAIQDCFGSTPYSSTTPLPSPTQTDTRESAHLPPAPISASHTPSGYQAACTKRRRSCKGLDEVPQNSQQMNKRRHHIEHEPQRVDEDTDAIEIPLQRVLEPGKRGNIPSEQEGPLNSSCEANGSQEPYQAQRIGDTVFVPQTALPDETRHAAQDPTFDTLEFGPRYSQDPLLLQGAAQGSMGDGMPSSLLHSQNPSDRELTSWEAFPNSDSDLCWTFPNFESGWTHGTWLSPFLNSDPNFYPF
ncbi:uncharacterized protein BDV17DRAFT_301043 [Aspergillus undulatus]|uniref:uncharacterized protein n=1 Tax=Aspergillus undulatus TaxID=1810928 RepID=UPI003CCD0E1D